MSDFDNVVPDWGDVPENDDAEPGDLMVAHEATPEEVAAVAEDSQDSDESQDSDDASDPEEIDVSEYETKNGWYEIPGMENAVHGEKAAREALAEVQEDEA